MNNTSSSSDNAPQNSHQLSDEVENTSEKAGTKKAQLERRERIYHICEELFRTGQTTSVRNVLARMPDVNSTSTINVDVRRWNDEQKAKRLSSFQQNGFSDEFVQLWCQEIDRLSSRKDHEHNEEVSLLKDEADVTNECLVKAELELELRTAELADATTLMAEMKTELRLAQDKLETAQKETTQRQTDHNAQLATLNEEHQTALSNLKSDHEATVSKLQEDNQQLQANYTEAMTKVGAASAETEHAKSQLAEMRSVVDELRNSLETTKGKLVESGNEVLKLQGDKQTNEVLISQLTASRDQLKIDLEQVNTQFSDTYKQNIQLQTDLNLAQTQKETLNGQLAMATQQNTDMRITISEQSGTIERMEGMTKRLELERQDLSDKLSKLLPKPESDS
ncbi:DNA-binding protein [Vibrio sp. SCSIO 43140]|uniref:DNA-binding protein n=1 Tax=Vibrio sp. SCSIO 43140 TaxID=2819100 RepID=UPI0020750DB6|nr:DNA-binding protein [Vibrio sp. SCSIO 43140]USD58908.1 DNA-binding protein [Vibrio sp. SCSIO 43140]